jgi:LPS O-antigen subunit length determinant protein (WzzB/FepE family)
MTETDRTIDDELSLFELLQALWEGRWIVIAATVVGAGIGLTTALTWPEKFQATALIEPLRVASKPVEEPSVLAEKMRSATYYSSETLQQCGIADKRDPAELLAARLGPNVRRQAGTSSTFVSVTFRAPSRETAAACLQSILLDVHRNQADLSKPLTDLIETDIKLTEQRLDVARTKQQQELALNRERLQVSTQRLEAAQKFIADFESNTQRFDFGNDRFSASSLLLATIVARQNEARELQIQINDLEMRVKAAITSGDEEVLKLQKQATDLRRSLLEPSTRKAQFATPVYVPETRVEPRRTVIVAIGLLAGGFLGLLILFGRSAWRRMKRESTAQASA